MPDPVEAKEGYSYILTAEAVSASPSATTPENITLVGMSDRTSAEITDTVYDMSTGSVTMVLAEQESYNQYYIAFINGERYEVKTEEILPAASGSVSLRSVSVSDDGTTAVISVYNSTYSVVAVNIIGTDSEGTEAVTAQIYIDPESIGSTTVSGEGLDTITWEIITE